LKLEEGILTSQSTRDLNKQRVANEGVNAATGRTNAQTANLNAKANIQEQDRLDRIQAIDPATLYPAVDKSSGKAIPGLFMTKDGKPIPWESDMANLSPEQSDLARLKGALLTLEGLPDDQHVDVDGGEELRDLGPIGWVGRFFSGGNDKASIVREQVRGKIAELEARQGQSGGVRRYNQGTGTITP
jgi:hypothetical protein